MVLLDLAMPGMDGLTALPEIIRRGRGARVLVVSAAAGQGADACIRAMTLGAADTLEKPAAGNFRSAFSADLIDKVRRIGGEARNADRPDRPWQPPVAIPPLPESMSPKVAGAIDCLAIGASTGGLHALSELFAALPASCDTPILITQHLPASFMPFFAAQMTEIAGRPAAVAAEGVSLLPRPDPDRAGRRAYRPAHDRAGCRASTSSASRRRRAACRRSIRCSSAVADAFRRARASPSC